VVAVERDRGVARGAPYAPHVVVFWHLPNGREIKTLRTHGDKSGRAKTHRNR